MERKVQAKGVILMIISALCTTFGQLIWKIGMGDSTGSYLIISIIAGFTLYGIGALSMIIALKFGELSVLHPMMCIGYVFTLINAKVFLGENITMLKIIGVILIIIGVIFMTRGGDHE